MKTTTRNAFTLIELLTVVAIIAILAGISMPAYSMAIRHAHCAGCSAHMRALGIAFTMFATDNDGALPGRVVTGSDKWPVLLLPYVPNPQTYADPGDPVAVKVPNSQMVSNTANNSSFFFNGFNDLGAYTDPTQVVTLANIAGAGPLAILGEKVSGSTQYYMDFVEGNQDDILNKQTYFAGSNYTFADGSTQFITAKNYDDTIWLVNKAYPIPPIPSGH